MIRALSTTISLPNGQVQSVLWGLPEKSQQHETIMVGHALKHFRAVDVSVVGIRITEENPYKATLTSVFPDGSRRSRTIEGVVQRIYLDNIRPEYSRVYHIKESVPSSSNSVTSGISTTSEPQTKNGGGRFHYREQFRDNEVRDAGQKRQTKDRMWPLEDVDNDQRKKGNDGLDQQQLLMASADSSSAASATLTSFARPPQYCLFSLLLVVLLQQ